MQLASRQLTPKRGSYNARVSLRVDVYTRTADGAMEVLDVPANSSDLAGFESWRRSVWGSDRVRALGAEFFPVLATQDLYVEPDGVERFQRECALLRANLEVVAEDVDPLNPRSADFRTVGGRQQIHAPANPHAAFVATVSARLANIEDAARRALAIGAGVVIW
jgi:hypothetical protein